MLADNVEVFENGEVSLEVHDIKDSHVYWLRGGVGYIAFSEEQFKDLLELLTTYAEERLV